MSWFSDLFGGGQRKDIDRGRAQATDYVNAYYEQGRKAQEKHFERALTFLKPQLEAAGRASGEYESALGLKGVEAQRDFQSRFTTSPGYKALLDARSKAVMSSATGGGYALSGRALRELADEGQKTMTEDYNRHLDRLGQWSTRGDQVALGTASMTNATGADLAKGYYGQGGTLANIELQSAAARAGTRVTFGDLAKVAATAVKAYSLT